MPDETQEMLQTPAPDDTALFPDEAAVLRAADAWQVKGISVADAVRAQTTFSARVSQLKESEAEVKAYWNANGFAYLDLNRYKPEASALAVVPAGIARAHRLVPMRKVDNTLWVAMENPRDNAAIDDVRLASRCRIIPVAAVPEGIIPHVIFFAYPQQPEPAPIENRASENGTAELAALVRDLQNEVRELKQEMQGLKKQVAAQQLAPPVLDARPAAYPTPSVFRATPTAKMSPFPLFRD